MEIDWYYGMKEIHAGHDICIGYVMLLCWCKDQLHDVMYMTCGMVRFIMAIGNMTRPMKKINIKKCIR